MSDPAALMTELNDLRRERGTLRERVLGAQVHGQKRRQMIDRLRQLTRRELTIETQLLPMSTTPAPAPGTGDDPGRELEWWQK